MTHHSHFQLSAKGTFALLLFPLLALAGKAPALKPNNFLTYDRQASSRPMLIYITSGKSYESKEMTREMMNQPQVNATLRRDFDCQWIDADRKTNRKYLRSFGVRKYPAVVLLYRKHGFQYRCKMGSEARLLLDQASFFLSAISIQNQAADLVKLNRMSRKQALLTLARSYVKNDRRKTQAGDPYYYARKYTLGMKSLAVFRREYVRKWKAEALVSKKR